MFAGESVSLYFISEGLFCSACNTEDSRDIGSIPELGRLSGEGNDNALQYSCWENPMDREARQATGHGVTKSQTQLNMHPHTHFAGKSIHGWQFFPYHFEYIILFPSLQSFC